jgi:hypothetical protein
VPALSASAPPASPPWRTRLVSRSLGPEVLAALVAKCRAESTTVTGTLELGQ